MIPDWATFEVHGVENRDVIYIISIDAPEYQEIRFVTDENTIYESETEEDQPVGAQSPEDELRDS